MSLIPYTIAAGDDFSETLTLAWGEPVADARITARLQPAAGGSPLLLVCRQISAPQDTTLVFALEASAAATAQWPPGAYTLDFHLDLDGFHCTTGREPVRVERAWAHG